MKNKSNLAPELSKFKMRVLGVCLAFIALSCLASFIYFLNYQILPIYHHIYLSTSLIETPYMVFGILAIPPTFICILLASCICIWTGRKFDPPKGSWLYRLQVLGFWLSVKILTYIVPATAILTTLTLLATGYTTCSQLRKSSSNWQVFWVNDSRFCFKPDFFNDDKWPCKKVNGKDICLPLDGTVKPDSSS